MPLDVAETKEEQQIGVGKARVWRQGKKIEFVLIFVRLDVLNRP